MFWCQLSNDEPLRPINTLSFDNSLFQTPKFLYLTRLPQTSDYDVRDLAKRLRKRNPM
jgi:hypothetical protein